jgi:hypothetical protein
MERRENGTAILISVAAAGAVLVLHGWVFKILWWWFVAPVFGLPALTVAQALGIGLMVSFLTKQLGLAEKEREAWESVLESIAQPFLVLGFGWLVHQFC